MAWWTHKEPTSDDVMQRLAAVETKVTTLQIEWASVADKLLHRLQRQAKRDRDAIAAQLEGQDASSTPPPTQNTPLNRKAALRARLAALRGNGNATRE